MAKKKPTKGLTKHEKEYLSALLEKDPTKLTDAERNTITNFSKDRRNKKKKKEEDLNKNQDEYLSGFINKHPATLTNSEHTSNTNHSQKKSRRNNARSRKKSPNIKR